MGGTIQFDGFDPSDGSVRYMRSQLWRRGLRNRYKLADGLDLAVQKLMIDLCCDGETLPADWPGRRKRLDRAVHRAMRDLRPGGTSGLDLSLLPVNADPATELIRAEDVGPRFPRPGIVLTTN